MRPCDLQVSRRAESASARRRPAGPPCQAVKKPHLEVYGEREEQGPFPAGACVDGIAAQPCGARRATSPGPRPRCGDFLARNRVTSVLIVRYIILRLSIAHQADPPQIDPSPGRKEATWSKTCPHTRRRPLGRPRTRTRLRWKTSSAFRYTRPPRSLPAGTSHFLTRWA